MPASSPIQITSINAASAAATYGKAVFCGEFGMVAVAVQGNGTTSSGVVTIEEAVYEVETGQYTGTWSAITTVNASDVTGGAQSIIHLQRAAWSWIRTRISTVIGGGGTVTTYIIGSPN
jgi:hypothetical protein